MSSVRPSRRIKVCSEASTCSSLSPCRANTSACTTNKVRPGFTTRPLRWASLVGLAFTAFGVVILLVVLGRYAISGSPVPGFTFLASALAIFSGVQLLTLGVIGEYLARVHSRVMSRPTYAVREEVGGG